MAHGMAQRKLRKGITYSWSRFLILCGIPRLRLLLEFIEAQIYIEGCPLAFFPPSYSLCGKELKFSSATIRWCLIIRENTTPIDYSTCRVKFQVQIPSYLTTVKNRRFPAAASNKTETGCYPKKKILRSIKCSNLILSWMNLLLQN